MARVNFLEKGESLLKAILVIIVKFYQFFIARLLGGCNCRFEPTCSNYMLEAVAKKGLVKGFFLGLKRLLRCHPFSKKSGYDPV